MCDSLRADRLGCYGCPRPTSPALDRLADSSVLFEHCYSVRGLTGPAFASLFTGQSTRSHGIVEHGANAAQPHLLLLPEILRQVGYRTVGLFSNDVIKTVGLDRFGWDQTLLEQDEFLTARAVEILTEPVGRTPAQPLFLWLHLYPPHSPYLPRQPYLDEFDPDHSGPATGDRPYLFSIATGETPVTPRDIDHIIALYDANVRYVDSLFDKVLCALEARRTARPQQQVLVVFCSDHGEELAEHSHYCLHAASVYRASVHIPWIAGGLNTLPARTRVARTLSQIDILPTLLDLLGVARPSTIEGSSAVRFIAAPNKTGGIAAGRQGIPPIWWLRTPEWTYIHNPFDISSPLLPYPHYGLFRRGTDPTEQLNLALDPAFEITRRRLLADLERVRHGRTGVPGELLLCGDSGTTPAPGTFRVTRDPFDPEWVVVSWLAAEDGGEPAQPALLLAYSSRPWSEIQGEGLRESNDRQAAVARAAKDAAGQAGFIAIRPAPPCTLSIECFWGEIPAAGRVFLGADSTPQPRHCLRVDLASHPGAH